MPDYGYYSASWQSPAQEMPNGSVVPQTDMRVMEDGSLFSWSYKVDTGGDLGQQPAHGGTPFGSWPTEDETAVAPEKHGWSRPFRADFMGTGTEVSPGSQFAAIWQEAVPGWHRQGWSQRQLRLKADFPVQEKVTWNFLKVEESIHRYIDGNGVEVETREIEIIGTEQLSIEQGEMKSNVLTLGYPSDASVTVQSDGSVQETRAEADNLLRVEPVELSPKLLDSQGVEIDGSETPNIRDGRTNAMVEINPVQDRIAHREIKIRIGEGDVLEGRTVTWSMIPMFSVPATPENPGPHPAFFRGDWADSQTHPDRFEVSAAYGAYGFHRISQEQGRTEIDDEGYTAIRINLPPIGFNRARIRIQIEGVDNSIDLIDMEVPAVIVVDPGHGGTTNLDGSSSNNATSPTGVLEKNMALDYGFSLRDSLNALVNTNNLQARVLMTRTTDDNISGADRAAVARNNGADAIYIIHFNSFNGAARGTLEVRRTNGNVNAQEDIDLIDRVLDRLVPALQVFDQGANRRAFVAFNSAVASDINLGNQVNYHPIRAGYCEVEFIDNPQVDQLLNHSPNAVNIRVAISNATAEAIIDDIVHQPTP